MGTPTRFPGGLNTTALPNAMAQMGQLDPSKFHSFFDDFDLFLATDWTITKTGTGTTALTSGDGGLLLLTNTAAAPDAIWMQLVASSFLMAANKKAFFKCRFKVSDATQSVIQMGLVITDTTPLDATDGIYFQKDDGDAQIDVFVRKNATTGSISATNVGTLVSDTYITLAWYYDGVDSVKFYINDALAETLDGTSTYLPDAVLAVSLGIQNGEAVAKNMTVDYIFAAKER